MQPRLLIIITGLLLGSLPAGSAFAFDDFGLDLSGDADSPPVRAESRGMDGTAVGGLTSDKIFTDVDRIKVVQRKLIIKKGRFEMAPAFSISINDPFYVKAGGGLSTVFWAADTLGIFADVFFLQNIETANSPSGRRVLQANLLESRLRFLAAGGFQWSPIYGKISWFNDEIIHFDLFFSSGLGVAQSSTGTYLATTMGVGQRYLVNRWLALFFKVENRFFPEFYPIRGGFVSSLSNILTLSLGASVYFPTDFDYTNP